jgi:predicted transcriptional regulator
MIFLIGTTAQKIALVKRFHKEGRSKGEIALLTGASDRMVKKYIDTKDSEMPEDKSTVRGLGHEDAVAKLTERAGRVRELYESGLNITQISHKTGFTYAVIKHYLSADFSPVNGHYGKQREGKLARFRDEVLKMRADGLKYREIHEIIKERGYTGTQDALRFFISKEKRVQRDFLTASGGSTVEFVEKRHLVSLLYKPIEKVSGISKEQLSEIVMLQPIVKSIFELVEDFKLMLRQKDPKALATWIVTATGYDIPEINAFIARLRQDFYAVQNAIATEFSNGLAEGSVNKIKVIKRIMYGRCSFQTLRNKCLFIDSL